MGLVENRKILILEGQESWAGKSGEVCMRFALHEVYHKKFVYVYFSACIVALCF